VARKPVADAAKAKAEKQKKIVIGLGVVLALAMAYAVHTMMSLNKKPSASSLPQAAPLTVTTATTPAAPTGAPTTPPAAPTLSGGGVTAPTESAVSTQLVSAVKPPADAGQLKSFSLFESKDPFNTLGPKASAGGSSGKGSGSSGGSGSGGGSAPKTPPAPPTPPPTTAVISVNGVTESVSTGAAFPASTPIFQLVSLTSSAAKVSVVGGSYATGAATVPLQVNKPVTLENTADGTRYTLVLMPQGTVATGGSTSSSSPGASTTPAAPSTPTSTTGG
jgi:hypothetical protein